MSTNTEDSKTASRPWVEHRNKSAGPEIVEALARAAHETNRAYCIYWQDMSQPPWDEAPEAQKRSMRLGIEGALAGNTPEQGHECWLAEKIREGWVYGPEKDVEKKTHPCMRPYHELPPHQKKKDSIFLAIVHTFHRIAFTGTATTATTIFEP